MQATPPEPIDTLDMGELVGDWLRVLRRYLRWLIVVPLLGGVVALGTTYLSDPVFTASTTFMPPQQPQSSAATALASLGALGGLAAGVAGVSTPADRYVALMQSVTVSDRIIDKFGLMAAFHAEYRIDARRVLANRVRISIGKKDGLITVEVEDTIPQRAADIANRFVEELRAMTSTLAVSEAQQRRMYLDQQLRKIRDNLVQAQKALQASGFNPDALKAEPRAAAESYARLRAEATTADVRLQVLRRAFSEEAPEVRQQAAALDALRRQLALAERASAPSEDSDFIGKYREFKYQEAVFEWYARQLEAARADEAREGALIQVVDLASPPERKTRPRRAATAIIATIGTAFVLVVGLLVRHRFAGAGARREPPTT